MTKPIIDPAGFLPNGSGPLPFAQYWSFRAECLADLSFLMSANWHEMGIFPEAMRINRVAEGLPDVQCTMTLAAETAHDFEEGLRAMVRYLRDCDDLHIIVETLKHASAYDTNRDGPFSHDA